MKIQNTTITLTRRLFSSWLLGIGFCVLSPAAMTPDAKEKNWPANPEKHQITIRREAANLAQKKMIATAEAAPPDTAALQKAIDAGETPIDESQWWYREELGIRIPYAITAKAIEYFSKQVQGYGKQEFKRYLEPSSSLDYHASVVFYLQFEHDGKKFANVHVVTLKLTFAQNFAATSTEGMQFEKIRTVVLDPNGKLLAVFGDGPTEVPILAI